ncbi:transporter substrate-binding domain-containing protein [bacterium]|nr:transporter substrate-binding domain-containing protein [bacterium]MBQ9149648.1 transporter substrate-binding domain-containing protein [bacterium]
MKKYIVLLLIFLFSFFLFGCGKKEKELDDLGEIKKRGYLIVGVKTDSPPFGFYNKDKKLVGMDIDIAKEIASHVFGEDVPGNVKFVGVNAQNRISKLNSKEVDILVATMSVNEKRKLVLDFSTPYFVANQKIMIRKTSKISHLQYFNKNGRLAVVMGTTGEKVARLVAPNANLVGTNSYIEAYNLLVNKKVDAILGDDCILAGFRTKNLKIVNKTYSREFYAVALRKGAKSKELLNRVNSAITAILDERKINLITKKWILY